MYRKEDTWKRVEDEDDTYGRTMRMPKCVKNAEENPVVP